MSLNIFENTNLDFEVSLIKLDRSNTGDKIADVVKITLPIDSSAILNLEINESSLTMGAKGSITINNKFNILDSLNISTNSPNDLYVAISIKDIELDKIEIPETDKVVTLIGLVNNTTAGSLDIINNILIFNWEEAFVAATRKTQLEYFTGKGKGLGIETLKQVNVKQLAEAFNDHIYKLKSENWISVPGGTLSPNVKHDLKVTPGANVSVYDAIQGMLKESTKGSPASARTQGSAGVEFLQGEEAASVEDTSSTVGKVTYFRFVNWEGRDGKVRRKLKYDAFLSDRHIEFIKAVFENDDIGDFSDVYTEKFSIGPLAGVSLFDPNTDIYNKIETYNITRANIGRLREEVWGDYQITNANGNPDPSVYTTKSKKFADLEIEFIERDLGGLKVSVNLPLLDQKELRVFQVGINTMNSARLTGASNLQQQNRIAQTVIKSFLTIGETINFTVKGRIIRQPNKFIWIDHEGDSGEEDYKKLWYVNSVTHKFGDGKYNTDIIATKIFGDTTLEAITTLSKSQGGVGAIDTFAPNEQAIRNARARRNG